jgi:hypothetical protein
MNQDQDSEDPRPQCWRLSARAVRRFIPGDEKLGVAKNSTATARPSRRPW